MSLLRHRHLLAAVLTLLVPPLVTVTDHAADRKSNAGDATSVIDHQNQSVEVRLPGLSASKISSDMSQFRVPGLPKFQPLPLHDTFVASTAPSPSSDIFVVKNVDGFVFGNGVSSIDVAINSTDREDYASGFYSASASSTTMLLASSPIAEPAGTTGSGDVGSLLPIHDSSGSIGFPTIAAFEQRSRQPIVVNHEHETPRPVSTLPDDEPFLNPPQRSVQDAAHLETLTEGNIYDNESLLPALESPGQAGNSGSTIPRIISRLAPHAFDDSSQIRDPVQSAIQSLEVTPLIKDLVNYLPHFLFARTISTTSGGPHQAGNPLRLDFDAPHQAGVPPSPTYAAPPQAGASRNSTNGASPSAGTPLRSTFAAPPLKAIYGIPAQASAPSSATHVAPLLAGAPPCTISGAPFQVGSPRQYNSLQSSTYDASPEVIILKKDPLTVSGYNVVQADSYGPGKPSSEVMEEVFPATYYGTSSDLSWPVVATIHINTEDVRPRQVFISEVQLPASGMHTKHKIEETDPHVVTAARAKYDLTEPAACKVHATERHVVVLQGPTTSVNETRPADPSHQRPYSAVSQPEYNPSVRNGPPPLQPQVAQTSGLYMQAPQARQVQNSSYLPPQASHLIRGDDEKRQARESSTTKLRNEISAGLGIANNTYEYVKDFTYRASRILGAFWPGNWFNPTIKISQPVMIQSAPVAALVYR